MTDSHDSTGPHGMPAYHRVQSVFSRWMTLPGRAPEGRAEWVFVLLAIAAAVVVAVWVFATSAQQVLGNHIPMVFWDEWEMVVTWNQWALKGSLSTIIEPHNEHRLGPTRLSFLADFAFAEGTGYLNLAVIWLIQAGHLALLWWMFRRGSGAAAWAQVLVLALMVPFFFSARQAENLEIGFQVQFVGVFFLGSLAFWAFCWSTLEPDGRATRRPHWLGLLASFGLATTATLTMISGLLVWPVMLLLAIRRWIDWRALMLLVVASGLAWVLYFKGYNPPGHHPSPLEALGDPGKVLEFLVLVLGAPFSDDGDWRETIGFLSLFCAVVLMAYALLAREWRPNRAEATLTCVSAFAFGAMLVTTLGRVEFGLPNATVIRYATPVYVFFLSMVLVFLCRTRLAANVRWQAASAAVGAVVLAIVISVISVHPHHVTAQVWLLDRKAPGWTAIVSGVPDETALLLAYPMLHRTERRLRFLKRDGLAPFRGEAYERIGTPVAAFSGQRDDQACVGSIDTVEIVPPLEGWPGHGVRLAGWAFDKTASDAPRVVYISDQEGVFRGVAVAGWDRFDVQDAIGEVDVPRTGWKGHAAVLPGDVLTGWVLTSDDRLCRFREQITVPRG